MIAAVQTQNPDLADIQAKLSDFFPGAEECIGPLLLRLGYPPERVEKSAKDYYDLKRILEQLDVLLPYTGRLSGKKMLEVGSGFGLFVAYANQYLGCDAYGIEPAPVDFEPTYKLSVKLFESWSLDPSRIRRAAGENIPFPDNVFDVVYSTNVLEHVQDPKQVLSESVRVLKPGGTLQFVVPNYGSLWEGHYGIPWIPYLPKSLGRIYVRLCGKDPWFIDTLQLIHYFSLKKMLEPMLKSGEIEVLGYGEALFRKRMLDQEFSEWGGLYVLKSWVKTAKKLGLIRAAAAFLLFFKAHTPLVLTLRKKKHER